MGLGTVKDKTMELAPRLTYLEARCPCCGVAAMTLGALEAWTRLREAYGAPIVVNSGFRCLDHNLAVGIQCGE